MEVESTGFEKGDVQNIRAMIWVVWVVGGGQGGGDRGVESLVEISLKSPPRGVGDVAVPGGVF